MERKSVTLKVIALSLLFIASILYLPITSTLVSAETEVLYTSALIGVDFAGAGDNTLSNTSAVLDGRVGSGAFSSPGAGNRHRLFFLRFNISNYKDALSANASLKLRLCTGGDANNNASSQFAAYLLPPELTEKINNADIPNYGAARALGLISYNDNLIWERTAGLTPNTVYESEDFSQYFTNNSDETFIGIKVVGTAGLSIFINSGVNAPGLVIDASDELPKVYDPQYTSDQSFFGKWDAVNNTWITAPILQYGAYLGLNAVESYVKQNNYVSAKEALLTYYRTRNASISWTLPNTTVSDTANIMRTDMINEKIYSFIQMADVVGVTEISDSWGWREVSLRTGNVIKGCIFLLDSDMNGSTAEIYSRRFNFGQYAPYLEVVENGITRNLPVIADTYVSAGYNRNNNYGNSSILYAREEASNDTAGNPILPVSADTKRPYFRFNMSLLTGNVSSIKFKFYARSDYGAKKLFVFTSQNENSFNESELTWLQRTAGVRHYTQVFNCKQTGFLYPDPAPSNNPARAGASGDPDTWNTEYEWINYNTRLYPIEWLIARYRATGDEAYAEGAIDFLTQIYIKSGNRANQGASYPRDLEGAWRTEYLCHAFFGTLNSASVTSDILVAQLKYIYAHLERFLVSPASTAANQNSAARIGALRVQAYFPELRTAAHWTLAKLRLKEMYVDGIGSLPALSNPDGSYTEGTSGYMDGTVNELSQCLKMLGAYDGEDDPYYKMFSDTYDGIIEYMLNMCLPYGLTPGYGDGGRGNLKGFLQNQLSFRENPRVRYYVSGGAQGETPPYTSKLFPDKAAAFLKDGWNVNSLGAFINSDHGGSHSHSDDLSLDVSAYGAPLLVDAGNTSYSTGDPMLTTTAKTLSHNTVEISNYPNGYNSNSLQGGDQTSFNTSAMPRDPGRLSLAANKLFDFVNAGSDVIYTGYDVNRKVLFLHDKYWIVNDRIIPPNNSPNTYKQAWHPDANASGERGALADINPSWDLYPSLTPKPEPINKITIDSVTKIAKSNLYGPNIQVVPADPQELDARKEQYYQATPKYGATYSNYVRYVRENVTGASTFDTVLYPDKTGAATQVSVQRLQMPATPRETASALMISYGNNKGYYYTSNETTPSERAFGDYSANGEMSYIETTANGKITMATVTNTSSLKKGSLELIASNKNIRDLGVEWNGAELNLYTEDGASFECGLKIYSESCPAKVKLNGAEILFDYHDNTVIIGAVAVGNGISVLYQPSAADTAEIYSDNCIGNATVILAAYDENNGSLAGINAAPLEIKQGRNDISVFINGLDSAKKYRMKLMIWGDLDLISPITRIYKYRKIEKF